MKKIIAIISLLFTICGMMVSCSSSAETRKGPGDDTQLIADNVLDMVTTEQTYDFQKFKAGIWNVYDKDGQVKLKEYEFTDSCTECIVSDEIAAEALMFEYEGTEDGKYKFYFGATGEEKTVSVFFQDENNATIVWDDGAEKLIFDENN